MRLFFLDREGFKGPETGFGFSKSFPEKKLQPIIFYSLIRQ